MVDVGRSELFAILDMKHNWHQQSEAFERKAKSSLRKNPNM